MSRVLADHLDIPHLELDSVFHQEEWTPLPAEEMKAEVGRFISGDRWVIDGNYPVVSEMIWQRADTVVWLDLSRGRAISRLVRRTVWRGLRRAELWNGNREDLRNIVKREPEENLLLWAWTRHVGLRERYEVASDTYGHVTVHRLRDPREVDRFLQGIGR